MNIVTEKKLAAGLSITSNDVIIILKLIAGVISGSISIISEAIHSLSDFLASVLTFLIIFAAFYIMYEAGKKLCMNKPFEVDTTLGIAVMLFAVVANFVVSSILFKVAKKSNSISLFADGEHLRTDIYSSLGVMVGLILIKVTGIHILDPIIAILVALFILKAGFSISKETLNNLLDGSLPAEDLKSIEEIIHSYKSDYTLDFKNLKARRCGPSTDIELTMLFPKDMTIEQCHDICDEVEELIRQKLGHVIIMIHAEPECPKCKNK